MFPIFGVGKNFIPRSPRGERRLRGMSYQPYRAISIHAPREGSDRQDGPKVTIRKISIHAPREGSDGVIPHLTFRFFRFQSTLPARGATFFEVVFLPAYRDFIQPSPGGVRIMW